MTIEQPFIPEDADDVLVCEYEKRPKGAPSFLDLHDSIAAVVREGEALRVEFDASHRAAVEQLVAAERLCCPTIAWELSPPPRLALTIRGRLGQLATLQHMLTIDLKEDDGNGA